MKLNVNPIPSGFHTLIPHLVLKGASKAIEFCPENCLRSLLT
jgi:hypothetical protein